MNDKEINEHLPRARRQDPDSLAVLCEHFYPKVLQYMRYRTKPETAEDLTGDVFLRMMRHIGRQKGSLVAWLYRIAANVVTDHYRRRNVRQTESLDEAGDLAPATSDMAGTVQARLDLETAMRHLTDEQREFVVLKFIQGLSNADIAEITGKKLPALRALQFRALSALRVALQHEETGNHA